MRLDTYAFRRHLIEDLESPASGAQIVLDDCDVIRLRLRHGDRVEIHLIEREVDLEEILMIFAQNQSLEEPVHTLYVMWCDMTLPDSGDSFEPDDWLLALHAIFNNKIYAYKVYGDESFIYPIFLEYQTKRKRRVIYGEPIRVQDLNGKSNRVYQEWLQGEYMIADFNDPPLYGYAQDQADPNTQQSRSKRTQDLPPVVLPDLLPHYEVLQLNFDADHTHLKQAYRRMARQFHPDVNRTADAHHQMQRINEAYSRVLDYLDNYHSHSA